MRRNGLSSPSTSWSYSRHSWTTRIVSLTARRLDRLLVRSAAAFGTPSFVAAQTLIVTAWVVSNVFLGVHYLDQHPHDCVKRAGGVVQVDSGRPQCQGVHPVDWYPFIALNLLFSIQAAYAAPIILYSLARDEENERRRLADDRARADRTGEMLSFIAREVAAARMSLETGMTKNFVTSEVDRACHNLRRPPQPPTRSAAAAPSRVQ